MASGRLIALHDHTFAEQVAYEKRLRRLEEVEVWMGNLLIRDIEVEDAYDILKIEIGDEYTSLYHDDYNAYGQMVLRVADQQLRATAGLIHLDKMTTPLSPFSKLFTCPFLSPDGPGSAPALDSLIASINIL